MRAIPGTRGFATSRHPPDFRDSFFPFRRRLLTLSVCVSCSHEVVRPIPTLPAWRSADPDLTTEVLFRGVHVMYRHLTLRKAFGSLTLGTALLVASPAFAEGDPPLSAQLNDLGRQALAQGRSHEAKTFFQKALQLNPADVEAQRGLDATVQRSRQLARLRHLTLAPSPRG